jgi:hypothetical protein
MHVLVELIRIVDAGHDKRLGSADQRPQSSSVSLSDNIGRDAISACVPASGKLTSDKSTERHSLGDKDASTLLEANKPFARRLSPSIAFLTMLKLEFVSFFSGHLHSFEIVCKLNLLVKTLPLWIIAFEKLGFCTELKSI